MVPLVLPHRTCCGLGLEIRETVGRDRGGIEEDHSPPVGSLGEVEKLEGTFHVDLVAGDRSELGAGREDGGEVVDPLHLVLREDSFEQMGLEDRTLIFVFDRCRQSVLEGLEVDGDDRGVSIRGEPLDQAVPDLAAGAGNQGYVLAHEAPPPRARFVDAPWAVKFLFSAIAIAIAIGIAATGGLPGTSAAPRPFPHALPEGSKLFGSERCLIKREFCGSRTS